MADHRTHVTANSTGPYWWCDAGCGSVGYATRADARAAASEHEHQHARDDQ